VHLQPAYRDLGYEPGSLPVTERLAGEILSLPIYPELPSAAVDQTARAIRDFESL
jgi:dTDP-4-amino-4,6-dideoxygalactose transaminase